ncbi:TRAP-type C4-dicarboxylate transport system permease small subunit [Bacillus pakistanensis]|uniref:TRAP-type C4-dicarboxylate transport system permease small subunit n=1 Tax=Rossellomorea pakistanensis TaxID=992288 RepID=A0ABS2NIQ7_9BACI|nr:TRAP transporter small permease [Bacillus pakistanensis]MBM7587737.1 TRAP-type C4-dicarboxylate transport system permease small subunit [Bacillus pakistanensis]
MKVIKFFDEKFEEAFLVLTLILMVALIFMQVVGRYALGNAPSWTEELARYIHIWQVWIGASFAVKKQEHIKIAAFVNLFSGTAKKVIDLLAVVIWCILAMFLAFYGTELVLVSFQNGQLSPAIQVPMWIPFLAIPLGSLGMVIRLIQRIVFIIRTPYQSRKTTLVNEVKEEVS